MRPLAALFGIFRFRLGLGLSGIRLRARTMLSTVMVLAGVGGAIGYAVVSRTLRDLEDDASQDMPDR
ncbi:MAG: hypothetical protein KF809_04330 [Chloroflexi bacterium]|nr:hypothetical protein [Chloroflexota bacterium]